MTATLLPLFDRCVSPVPLFAPHTLGEGSSGATAASLPATHPRSLASAPVAVGVERACVRCHRPVRARTWVCGGCSEALGHDLASAA